ncbi:hypothetical protein [Micromonospora sp. WMMD975]|uniref:hypothetical protein n=1 Tax=Micromonospora sp. WMMD975 TaxID=3016087 RepID=UPI00249C7E27|nr:hypothetical protein [Micromonospora sp. WMMD975]WFE34588.1 hypothetical protein O7613_04165 [Micromonospora sp. WMMD975]
MTSIRNLLRGGRSTPGDVVQHTVGNALVLHHPDEISGEAQSLALSVVADGENDLVVLDLGSGIPIGSWESMAGVLPRRRRGIRLVACGQRNDTAAMAGQWLSERLNRTVIAPDGDLVRGSAGALFVHSKPGSGWVRFRPGKAPAWDAKRYPTPVWDTAATERRASSSTGEIEPLPGGVWIHDVRAPEVVAEHRGRLVADLPCQPDTMTVLLGCPGTEPLSLDDVVRFWRDLDPDNRLRTRFVQYGEVRMPEGESFGQTLADQLGAKVVCYPGVPIGAPGKFEIRTVRADGVLGWPPFAQELGYSPRAHPNSLARRPLLLSHRGPLRWTEEIAPRVYWYAPDAVVEVIEAGLWIRPADEPGNAERVRATPLDPEGITMIFDDTESKRTARMRELADDLAARIDRAMGQPHALFPASVLVPGQKPGGHAAATLTSASPSTPPAPAAGAAPAPEVAAEIPTVGITGIPEPIALSPAPPAAPAIQVTVSTSALPPAPTVRSTPSLPPAPVIRPAPAVLAAPPVPPVSAAPPEPVAQPAPVAQPVVPVAPSAPVAPPAPVEIPTESTIDGPAPVGSPGLPGATATAGTALPPSPPTTPPVPARPVPAPPVSTPAVVPAPVSEPAGGDVPVGPAGGNVPAGPAGGNVPAGTAGGDLSTTSVRATEPAADSPRPGARLQPVVRPDAAALLPVHGLAEERAWLRRSLSRDFDAMASSVSRIMSEHPGMKAGGDSSADDILVDSVATRLFLTRRGAGIDAGLRSGAIGPHVPLARCAVSGLSRLPSYRGSTIVRTSPTADEWDLYRGRRLVTDWSFVAVLTAPCAGQDGDTDVLIWSMTARRTALLEPEGDERVEDRVVFLPGTHFKILEATEPDGGRRGAILLREIGANEIDDDGRVDRKRLSLDELAVTSLRRSVDRWAGADPRKRIGVASAGRFGTLPGLVGPPAGKKG